MTILHTLIRRSACAACCALLVCAVAPGAGGGPAAAADPVVWATQVCSALNLWQNTVDHRAGALSGKPRAKLLTAIAATTADTVKLRAAVGVAGTPGVVQGDVVEQSLQHAVAVFAGGLARDRAHARKLPAAGGPRVTAIAAALARQSKAVGATFIGLGGSAHSTDLDGALDQVPQCAVIHG
jgi:hypothetical protein